jgi:SAM-dependent methyltransferase
VSDSTGKTDAEFLAAATVVINNLEKELRRVKAEERSRWRALEIGCGAGRLLRPMSRHFLEIHGVDVSEARVREARGNLQDLPQVHLHVSDDNGLGEIAEESIDFVYSYDFFQQIRNREAAVNFLREAQRVLRPGGLARLEFAGGSAGQFSSRELLEFAHAHDFQVLALEGVATPSLWTTWRKRPAGHLNGTEGAAPAIIRRITNASSFEPVAPCRGRFASICLRVENLPRDAGLHDLRVTIGNSLGTITYIGPADRNGWQQIYADLPELEATGLLPVQLFRMEDPLSEAATLRVIPPGPAIPRILYAPKRAEGRMVSITLEEVARPYELEVTLGGRPVEDLEKICTDPRAQRYEVKFHLPEETGPGLHHVNIAVGRRKLAPWALEVNA